MYRRKRTSFIWWSKVNNTFTRRQRSYIPLPYWHKMFIDGSHLLHKEGGKAQCGDQLYYWVQGASLDNINLKNFGSL